MQAQATAASLEGGDYAQQVLLHVLTERPTIFRLCDLVSELARDPEDFGDRDDVEQAVRDMIRAGLLFREGACILPTPAAVFVEGMELG